MAELFVHFSTIKLIEKTSENFKNNIHNTTHLFSLRSSVVVGNKFQDYSVENGCKYFLAQCSLNEDAEAII